MCNWFKRLWLHSSSATPLWAANLLAAVAVFFAVQACGGPGLPPPPPPSSPPQVPSQWGETVQAPPPAVTGRMATTPTSPPAPFVSQATTLRADFQSLPADAQVDYEWTPPLPNVLNVNFIGRQPDNPAGPPPYRFSNVPRASGQSFDVVTPVYTWPSLPEGRTSLKGTETFQVKVRSSTVGSPTPTQLYYTLQQGPTGGSEPGAAPSLPAQPSSVAAPASDVSYLTFHRWLDAGFEMNPELCQAYADALTTGQLVWAIQLPASPVAAGSPDYYMPVPTHADSLRPFVKMQKNQYPNPPVGFSTYLQPAPQVLSTMENMLPSKEGHRWFALTGAPELAVGNCATFSATTKWSAQMDVAFNALPVEGQVLTTYYCFTGENPLLLDAFTGIAPLLAGGVRATTAADPLCCLTCIGPIPLPLTDMMTRFEIENTWADFEVQPTGERVAFQHRLRNAKDTTSLAWAYEQGSLQGLNWGLYADSGGAYNLRQPISKISGGTSVEGTPFWIVSDPVTKSVPVGIYTVRITGTSPASAPTSSYTTDTACVIPLMGDANGDGLVNAADFSALADCLAGNRTLVGQALLAADVDFNGKLDSKDLELLAGQAASGVPPAM